MFRSKDFCFAVFFAGTAILFACSVGEAQSQSSNTRCSLALSPPHRTKTFPTRIFRYCGGTSVRSGSKSSPPT